MFMFMTRPRAPDDWPHPLACLRAADLGAPPQGALVAVCGLVIVRQRPGSAKGVIFVTLEDETGVVNVIVWAKVYERFRRAVIASRLMRVTASAAARRRRSRLRAGRRAPPARRPRACRS